MRHFDRSANRADATQAQPPPGRRPARLLLVATAALGLLAAACGVVSDGRPAPASPTALTAALATPAPVSPEPTGTIAVDASPTAAVSRSEPTALTTSPVPSPTPARAYPCKSGPCPRNLAYAVDGCSCLDQVYEGSSVSASYCCASGYSDSPCPESSADQPVLKSTFGSTESEIRQEMVTVELDGWPTTVHAKAAPAFRRVAERLKSVEYQIREPIGSFNWRVTQGSDVLSMHSFGLAVDINPSTNPRCSVTQDCRCDNDLITDLPPDFVQAFKDEGFDWGGDWAEHPDPMHFEWVGWRH